MTAWESTDVGDDIMWQH